MTLTKRRLPRLAWLDLVMASTPLLLVLAAACRGGGYAAAAGYSVVAGVQPGTATDPAAGDAATAAQVEINDFAFSPATLTIAVGTTVTWTNHDSLVHTVTANDGSFDSSNLKPGQQFSYSFNMPGSYGYHCSIHPFMTATVTVGGNGQ